MSNKISIVTDSATCLPEGTLQQYQITVIPLSIIWGDQVYRDGVDLLHVRS